MNEKTTVLFSNARELLREGDVLLFRGRGIVSSLIRRAGEGCYTHVGVASQVWYGDDAIWECVEFREWKGGRSVNLQRYVDTNSGTIDVFRPASSRKYSVFTNNEVKEYELGYNGIAVTQTMRRMTGLPYGWKRIAWIAQHKLPLLRLFYPLSSLVSDNISEPVYPVCSTAVSYAFSKIRFDLTHHRSDQYMEPSDVARSALLHYVFTLVSG